MTFNHNVALVSGALAYANYMNAFGSAAHALKYESGLVGANAGMIKYHGARNMTKRRADLHISNLIWQNGAPLI